jgi:hypothetical protein
MVEEDKKYWLDKYGERYWYKNSDVSITANRAYYWKDRVIFTHESKVVWCEPSELIPYGHYSTTDRHILHETTYTSFSASLDTDEWTPIDNFETYTEMLRFEYECRKYNI